MSGPSLKDVPDRYDVVFQLNDGSTYGFLLADSVESNLPFRTHKALYSYSPTFLERQNVSNQYGDNFQDFFLTGSQDDFSLGEQQKFFRVNDVNRSRRYWAGLNVEPTAVPGNVTLTYATSSASLSKGAVGVTPSIGIYANGTSYDWITADNTNLYGLSISSGSITASTIATGFATSTVTSMATDPNNVYGFYASASTSKIAKNVVGTSTVTTFSTPGAFTNLTSMVYLNNILYSYNQELDALISYDTSGNPTTQFQWLTADGSHNTAGLSLMIPYGGSLYILRSMGPASELWEYDGSGVQSLGAMPPDFITYDIAVSSGIVFISGNVQISHGHYLPQIYYYVNGSLGKLWESQAAWPGGNTTKQIPICAFGNGVVFKDPTTGNLLQYDISVGGVHCIANDPNTGSPMLLPSNLQSCFLLLYSSKQVVYGGGTTYNSSGYIQTSQYDFDNTLTKIIRGIKVDADIPANTSVDIAYQLDGCGGSYTTLQTGVTSGQEYLLPASTSAHSVSVQVTLNSSTGTATPTLKRVYVRAAPLLDQFRKREYLFDLSGGVRENLGLSARQCRDGTVYPYDPITAANNLKKVALQTVPYTVVDKFGLNPGFTVLADLEQNQEGYDGFAIYEVRPDVYIGRINVREV